MLKPHFSFIEKWGFVVLGEVFLYEGSIRTEEYLNV